MTDKLTERLRVSMKSAICSEHFAGRCKACVAVRKVNDDRIEALEATQAELVEALQSCLNYIENTESELGITLDCGDAARAALAKLEAQP